MIDIDKYEGVTRFDLVEQHNIHELAILLLDQFAEVKRLREGIENILKNHNFPFILSGLKLELKELIE